MQFCGAKTRSGEPCKNAAMPNGRCRMHGGKSTGRPIIHGRYSLKHRQSLAKKQEEFLNDPNPGDLTAELALMRSLLQDYLDRYVEGVTLPLEDIERIMGMIENISRLVERVAKIINQTALTQAEVLLLQKAFIAVLDEFLEDDNQRILAVDKLQSYIELPSRVKETDFTGI